MSTVFSTAQLWYRHSRAECSSFAFASCASLDVFTTVLEATEQPGCHTRNKEDRTNNKKKKDKNTPLHFISNKDIDSSAQLSHGHGIHGLDDHLLLSFLVLLSNGDELLAAVIGVPQSAEQPGCHTHHREDSDKQ